MPLQPVDEYDDSTVDHPEESEAVDYSDEVHNPDGTVNWEGLARDAYEASTDYFDTNIRKQLERNLFNFRGKHAPGSKYHLESYKFRSKNFRPKTRAMIRGHEANAGLAFFSTADSVSTTAEDQSNKDHVRGAEYIKNLINYRLEHSIPWFQTVVGGYQDALAAGVVISRQEWIYTTKQEEIDEPVLNELGVQEFDEDRFPMTQKVKINVPDVDEPDIILIPAENFRFDPACDWRNPVKSSPYLIELIPMYIQDVKARMKEDNQKTGEKKWFEYSDGEIASSRATGDYDSTRSVREGDRTDSKDMGHAIKAFDIVWVHRNIIRVEGTDWLYYTLGTETLLSDPVPVTDVFLHGRPYAVGTANLETHKVYPAAPAELVQDLQAEANDISNQRLDNIKLILNKRYMVRRGSNTDFRALTQSTPGGIVLTDDLNDLKEQTMSDVTGSAYEEQNRINADFDELAGNFSSQQQQSNRSVSDTVGGMSMAADDSNKISEFQLRVYTETWVEQVLRQMRSMEIHYESDPRILSIASGKDAVDPEIVNELIKVPAGVRVGVGFGSTSPYKRIEKMSIGLDTIAKFAPTMMQRIDAEEISKEVFGALGYRDGSRFFKEEGDVDPMVAQLQQQLQELQKIIETKQIEQQGRMQVAQMNNETKLQTTQMQHDHKATIERINQKLKLIKEQVSAEKNDLARGELELQMEALEWQKKTEEIHLLTAERDKMKQGKADDEQKQYDRSREVSTGTDIDEGDGLVDDMGSTVMMNNNYQNVPMAEG